MRTLLLTGLLILSLTPVKGQKDSTFIIKMEKETFRLSSPGLRKNPYYRHKQLIAPTFLITAGAVGVVDKSPTDLVEEKAFKDINTERHKI